MTTTSTQGEWLCDTENTAKCYNCGHYGNRDIWWEALPIVCGQWEIDKAIDRGARPYRTSKDKLGHRQVYISLRSGPGYHHTKVTLCPNCCYLYQTSKRRTFINRPEFHYYIDKQCNERALAHNLVSGETFLIYSQNGFKNHYIVKIPGSNNADTREEKKPDYDYVSIVNINSYYKNPHDEIPLWAKKNEFYEKTQQTYMTDQINLATGKPHKKGFPFEYYVEVIPKNIKRKLETPFLNNAATKIQKWWKKVNNK